MHDDIVHIVGECFATCADARNVYTLDGLVTAIRTADASAPRPGARLVPGQGITTADWGRLCMAVNEARPDLVAVEPPRSSPSWLGTEKTNIHNVLIADLRPSGNEYRATLRIHPANVMLVDRDGARHLPGMLEVEACLQMAMATTAQHLTPPAADLTFVTTATTIHFDGFLFPLAAELALTVDARHDHPDGRLNLELSTSIIQGGSTVMRMSFTSTVFPVPTFDRSEAARFTARIATIGDPSPVERTSP